MSGYVEYREKECACGCGRVGHFHTYASNACKQRAYRQRIRHKNDGLAKAVSSWLVEMFGDEECQPIFENLNRVTGNKNNKHMDAAIESMIYLFQAKLKRETSKARRIR